MTVGNVLANPPRMGCPRETLPDRGGRADRRAGRGWGKDDGSSNGGRGKTNLDKMHLEDLQHLLKIYNTEGPFLGRQTPRRY